MISKEFLRYSLVPALMCGIVSGQDQPVTPQLGSDVFNQVPDGLQDAVRERAKLFYNCYLTGKFRQAEEYVAPDSKDDFYNVEKDRYHSYKISRIDFTDNFTRAKVMVIINVDFKFQGHVMQVDVPIISNWKVVDGKWDWFAIPRDSQVWNSPVGAMNPNTPAAPSGNQTQPGAGVHQTDPRAMQAMFSIMPILDKPVLTLNSGNQYQDSTFMLNRSQKPLKFQIESEPLDGLVLEPLSGVIAPGGSQTIRAAFKKGAKAVTQETRCKAYISVESGMKVQMYVNLEPATVKGSL